MSMHPSFGKGSKIQARKNVMKRYDRIEALKKQGRWKDGNSVYGLPKTKPAE